MKTAISLPDELFSEAEAAAQKLKVIRSRLYARAIEEFLERQRDQAITDRLKEVYSRQSSKLDPAFQRAQMKTIKGESW